MPGRTISQFHHLQLGLRHRLSSFDSTSYLYHKKTCEEERDGRRDTQLEITRETLRFEIALDRNLQRIGFLALPVESHTSLRRQ